MRPRETEVAADLTTSLGSFRIATPVLAASGTFGAGREASAFVDLAALGGIIVKSVTLTPWSGKPTPRMCETPSGMLNAIGIQNKGVEHFLTEDLPWLTAREATVIVSIAGNSVDEFVKVAHRIEAANTSIAAAELNISCPNLEDRSRMFAHSASATAEVVRGVKAVLRSKPLFAKLSPNVTSIPRIAQAALEAGADGLSLINTVFGMAIDVATRRPKLAGGMGGLSGPAIRPIAVRAVHEVHRLWPHVPIIGQGGVQTATDALELIMAGASAVAVGTANFVDPTSGIKVAAGLRDYMEGAGVAEISELVGCLKLEG